MAAIGSCWATDTWDVDAWAANTWADAADVVTAPAEATLVVPSFDRTLAVPALTSSRTLVVPAINRTLTIPDPE